MKLTKRFRVWWRALLERMYIRAGGNILKPRIVMLPANCVRLDVEEQFRYFDDLGRTIHEMEFRDQAVCRLAEKMIKERMVFLKIDTVVPATDCRPGIEALTATAIVMPADLYARHFEYLAR